jgi:hypothetical protein
MSKLDMIQLGSIPFNPRQYPQAFQTLGNTTNFESYPANMGIPATIAGAGGVNPVIVFDNRRLRATTAILGFLMTAVNDANLAFDLTGFSQIDGTNLYTRTKLFLGAATAGNLNLSTPLGEATAFAADNFSTKTFAASSVQYIEPNDDLSMALLSVDLLGHDYLMVRLAAGVATAAVKAQVLIGVV